MSAEPKESSFERMGFLSSDVSTWSESHIEKNAEVFSRGNDLARLALKIAFRDFSAAMRDGKLHFFLFSILFTRSISYFQAALLLLQRGMNSEARILVRSLLECTFMIAAAGTRGTEFVDRMIRHHYKSRTTMGLEFEKLYKKDAAFSADQIAQIRTILDDFSSKETETFDFYTAARMGGLENWYVFYRQLSSYAAHPTLDSLQSSFDPASEQIDFGPNSSVDDLNDIVDLACTFLIVCCQTFNTYFGEDTSISHQLDEEFKRTNRWREGTRTQTEEP